MKDEKSDEENKEEEEEEIIPKPLKLKKLRQRSSSPELVPVKLEEDSKENINKIPTKKTNLTKAPKVIDHNQVVYQPCHSPIHTPPPEQWTKQKPLYTIQPKETLKNYVVDIQVSLLLGFHHVDDFWKLYSALDKKLIHATVKSKLWPTFKIMLNEEKSIFLSRSLYFINLEDVMILLKKDYPRLLDSLITIHLDVGYEEIVKKPCSLPPKIAMKMKKCGYKFQQYS